MNNHDVARLTSWLVDLWVSYFHTKPSATNGTNDAARAS